MSKIKSGTGRKLERHDAFFPPSPNASTRYIICYVVSKFFALHGGNEHRNLKTVATTKESAIDTLCVPECV